MDLQRKRHHFILIGMFTGVMITYLLEPPENSGVVISTISLIVLYLILGIRK